jgi:hypothetical protein
MLPLSDNMLSDNSMLSDNIVIRFLSHPVCINCISFNNVIKNNQAFQDVDTLLNFILPLFHFCSAHLKVNKQEYLLEVISTLYCTLRF